MERPHLLPGDADLAALRVEHFTSMLETVLVFSTFYLIQQLIAAGGWFERALATDGSVGRITTHQGWIAATVLGLFLLPLLIRFISKGWTLLDFGFRARPNRRDLYLAAYLGVGMGLWFALGFWIRAAAFEDARHLLAVRDWGDAALYIFYVAMVASAMRSEFFFRGYVQRLLTAEYGTSWGTLLSLLFFWISLRWIGTTHVLALLVPMGIVAAVLFNRQGSLWEPLLYHALAFALGFLGYALLELTSGGYAVFTAALALIVLGGLFRMKDLLLDLVEDLQALVMGLESYWFSNLMKAIILVAVLLVLQYTSHADLNVHALFTGLFYLVFTGYKLGHRCLTLRDLFES
ncbi:MAG: CPBP family intramembrane glutamic endopeptidase [bacterium]